MKNVNYLYIKNLIKKKPILLNFLKKNLKKYNIKEYEISNLEKLKPDKFYNSLAFKEIKINEDDLSSEKFKEIIKEYLYTLELKKEYLKKGVDYSFIYDLFHWLLVYMYNISKYYNIKNKELEEYIKKGDDIIDFKEEHKLIQNAIKNIDLYIELFPEFKYILIKSLKYFNQKKVGYPSNITFEEWTTIINEMINFVNNHNDKKKKELFIKYFGHLWD